MEIPNQIKALNFVLVNGKIPFEKAWQKGIRRINDPYFQQHISDGGNYGVQSNGSSVIINGKPYFLVVIDFDTREFQDKVISQFPETFTTTSGSPKQCYHLWLASDNNKAFKIKTENEDTLADIIGAGNQVIAPGSKHSSGSTYSVVKDLPIAFMSYAEIEAILKPHDKSPKVKQKEKKQYIPKGVELSLAEEILNSVSMDNILKEVKIDPQKNPTNCFKHSSNGGKCFGFDDEKCHCFHCEGSWNKFSLIREAKNLTDKQTFEWFAEKAGRLDELKKERKEFAEKQDISKNISEDTTGSIFSRVSQAKEFFNKRPGYYSPEGLWYFWSNERCCYESKDEIDLLNAIRKEMLVDTIDSKTRGEILASLKQVGRDKMPEKAPLSWVQFKDTICDFKTLETFKASPKYFITNPIPWEIGQTEDTPTIDKLLIEWVGEDFKETLLQIIAYSACSDQFMQRLIALVGGGSNGKGTFIKLLKKFIGTDNVAASELKELSENGFEAASIYKKLVCIMGEISYDDLKNTNQIKKLAGEDTIRYCFKGKTPFSDNSVTTLISATNSLPKTPDKTLGFYRKWLIVDFPNQFSIIKHGVIESIPEVEFNNLSRKVLRILKELYQTQKFQNEGTFEERMNKYEERSNPVLKFMETHCQDSPGKNIELRIFANCFNEYAKKNHLRVMTVRQVSNILKEEGYETGKRKHGEDSYVGILNICFVTPGTTETTETTAFSNPTLRKATILDSGSSGSSGSCLDSFIVLESSPIEGNVPEKFLSDENMAILEGIDKNDPNYEKYKKHLLEESQ